MRPATSHETRRQMVEQLRVRGTLASRSEIVDRPHDPHAEQLLPDAIDRDPRGQRMPLVGEPVGQFPTAALPRGDREGDSLQAATRITPRGTVAPGA